MMAFCQLAYALIFVGIHAVSGDRFAEHLAQVAKHIANDTVAAFQCPAECQRCCALDSSVFSSGAFVCVLKENLATALPKGYLCSAAEQRDEQRFETKCEFKALQKLSASLPSCSAMCCCASGIGIRGEGHCEPGVKIADQAPRTLRVPGTKSDYYGIEFHYTDQTHGNRGECVRPESKKVPYKYIKTEINGFVNDIGTGTGCCVRTKTVICNMTTGHYIKDCDKFEELYVCGGTSQTGTHYWAHRPLYSGKGKCLTISDGLANNKFGGYQCPGKQRHPSQVAPGDGACSCDQGCN